MLRNSAYVLSKLILKLSQVLFARYKMVTLNDLVGFALTRTARYKKECRGWKARLISTSQRQADFQSPGFQIEHQIK